MPDPTGCPAELAQQILSFLDLGPTLGALSVGTSLSAILYGITVCQTFYYYRSKKAAEDTTFLKTLVGGLMLVVTVQQACLTYAADYYMAAHYDDPCVLLRINWGVSISTLLAGVVGLCVNLFLTHRVWKLSRNPYVTSFCVLVTVAHFAMNLVININTFIDTDDIKQLGSLQTKALATWSVSILGDLSLVVFIIFYLYRSRTGMRRSNDLISRLMLLTVSTGLITTCATLAGLVLYAIYPESYYAWITEFILGKLYLNSLLTTLNLRDSLLERRQDTTSKFMNSIPLSDVSSRQKTPRASQLLNIQTGHSAVTSATQRVSSDTRSVIEKPPSLDVTDGTMRIC